MNRKNIVDSSTTSSESLDRRAFLNATLAGTLGLVSGGSALAATASATRPNIILTMTDDQGWGDVGYNANQVVRTPVLDDMAHSGLRFDRFYAAQSVCSPTRGSCLTGRHPDRYHCFSWGYDLPLEEITLAEAVKTAGYVTGHFGKWHLGGIPTNGGYRTDRGNLKTEDSRLRHPGNQGFDEWFSYWNFFDLDPSEFYHNAEAVGPLKGEGSEITVNRALKFIGKAVGQNQPFFAVIWFGNPHDPHLALDEDKALYPGFDPKKQDYLGELTAVDRAMGQLRKGLSDLNVQRDTMLWFCSDNGATASGSNGLLRAGKGTLWEGGIRVPGILEWPARIDKPVTTDVPACTSDFYPTILELLRIQVPNQVLPLDGISLAPLIEGKMDRRPRPIAFEKRTDEKTVQWAALVDNQYKLHAPVGDSRETNPVALYDLSADIGEKDNLSARNPGLVKRMMAQLREWQASVEKSLSGADYR